jgi:hypothetical protein
MKMAEIATPSERNIAIHRDVCILGATVRGTAAAVGLSPSRVEAICQQVERWRAYMLPDWINERPPEARLVESCRKQLERLDVLFCRAQQAWEDSCAVSVQETESPSGKTTQSQTRSMALMMRVMREQIQVAAVIARLSKETFERAKQRPALTCADDLQEVESESESEVESAPEAACEPPASVLARGAASTETRVDQAAPSNDVNVLGNVVYGEMPKCNVLANPPPERNSRYERLTRAERRARWKRKRAIDQERTKSRTKSRAQEIKEKRDKLMVQV